MLDQSDIELNVYCQLVKIDSAMNNNRTLIPAKIIDGKNLAEVSTEDIVNFANKYTTIEDDIWTTQRINSQFFSSQELLIAIAKSVEHLFNPKIENIPFSSLPRQIQETVIQNRELEETPHDDDIIVFTSNYAFERWYFHNNNSHLREFVMDDRTVQQQLKACDIQKPEDQLRVIELFYPSSQFLDIINGFYIYSDDV